MSDAVNMIAAFGNEARLATFTPYGGTPRQFKVLVDYQASQVAVLSGLSFPENSFQVLIPRDPVNGTMTINKGKDRIRFKRNLSDTQETEYTVVMVVSEDAGMVSADGGLITVQVK